MLARLWTEEREVSGFSTDVSDSGFYVESNSLFPIGTRVHVELSPPGARPFMAEAVVVRHKKVPPSMRSVVRCGMGLRLLPLGSVPASEFPEDPEPETVTAQTATIDPITLDLSEPTLLLETFNEGISEGLLVVPADGVSTRGGPLAVRVQLPPPWGCVIWKGTVVQILGESAAKSLVMELDDAERIQELVRQILFDS